MPPRLQNAIPAHSCANLKAHFARNGDHCVFDTTHGEWFIYACLLAVAAFLLAVFLI